MKDVGPAEQIEEAAYAWIAKLDREGAGAELEAELQAWLSQDPRHRGAFLRAQAMWQKLDRASLAPVLRPAEARPNFVVTRRLLFAGGGALAAACAGVVWHFADEKVLETSVGEVRRVSLSDGSTLVLNTDSRVAISMNRDVRRIRLANGEAWFQVAKNPRWPFIVDAGRVHVRAVGTAFSVRRLDNGADVSVTEGVVEAWVSGADGTKVRIDAGQSAFIAEGRPVKPSPVGETEIARRLAWRSGEIDLNGETLAEAVAEFNRYNQRRVTVVGAKLQSRRVYGLFRTNDPEGFAKAAAVALGTTVEVTPRDISIGE
ncbi:MAG: FecR domain-containing protein [Alphaproteobacteria bacterium]|nr:FecR domain-containing protein [Alphaproteobacteria bacterium]MDE2111444.1 FecR domain-containing protein [Alphaproteobacteria bacterium]MDE2494195.1 FecR domain-containing protein [Alphaproteobacteria bacterium]